jgi:PIN domain nuclease of toxin-antitoxin system
LKVLVDSHALLSYVDADHLLTAPAHAAIDDPDNEILVSAATIWEMAIKVGIGKLTLARPYRECMEQALADLGATLLPVTVAYAAEQSRLPPHHGDPFDRLLVAQAHTDGLPIISGDPKLDTYGITRIW